MQAEFLKEVPAFALRGLNKTSGAKYQGQLYERKVQEYFKESPGVLPSPWIGYRDRNGREAFCQPDLLHFDLDGWTIRIIEIKIRHCIEARTQLLRYQDVVRGMFPAWHIRLVEVAKWVDPDVRGFGPYELVEDPLRYEGKAPIAVYQLRNP